MIEQTAEAMVKAVDLPGRPWTTPDGKTLTFYKLTLELNGEQVMAEWAKGDPEPPIVGEAKTFEFFERKGKQRVKLAASSGGGGGSSGGKGGGGTWKPRPPEEIAGARHAHNLLVASHNLTPLPLDPTAAMVQGRLQDLKYMADQLDEQTAKISEAAKGVGDAAGTPAPSQNGGDGVHQRIAALLEAAGVNPAAAAVIGDCVVDPEHGFTPAEQDAAIETLQKPNLQVSAVKRLEARAVEMRGGEPLPTGSPDDDLVF